MTSKTSSHLIHITLSHTCKLLDVQSHLPLESVHRAYDSKHRLILFDEIGFVYLRGQLMTVGGLTFMGSIVKGTDSRVSFSLAKQKPWWRRKQQETLIPPSIHVSISNRGKLLDLSYLGEDEPTITYYQRNTIAKIDDVSLHYGKDKHRITKIGNLCIETLFERFSTVTGCDPRIAVTLIDHKTWRR
ncbi:MAG: hypothetical protein AAFV98_03635 [Chloroflexota bacterium]